MKRTARGNGFTAGRKYRGSRKVGRWKGASTLSEQGSPTGGWCSWPKSVLRQHDTEAESEDTSQHKYLLDSPSHRDGQQQC